MFEEQINDLKEMVADFETEINHADYKESLDTLLLIRGFITYLEMDIASTFKLGKQAEVQPKRVTSEEQAMKESGHKISDFE